MSKYQNYGNVKMRGKKYKLLSCRCCEAVNKKKLQYDRKTETPVHLLQENILDLPNGIQSMGKQV